MLLVLVLSFYTRNFYQKFFISPVLFVLLNEVFRFGIQKREEWRPLLYIRYSPLLISFIYINLFHFSETLISLPTNLALLGFMGVYWLFFMNRKLAMYTGALFGILCLAFGIIYWDNYNHWRVYGAWNKEEVIPIKRPLLGVTESGQTVDLLVNVQDSLVVIDTWNSTCGACFRLIPSVDSIAKQYPAIKFLSLNYPMKRDSSQTLEFTFNLYRKRLEDESSIQVFQIAPDYNEKWHCPSFPTFFVIEKNHIIFKGAFREMLPFLQKKVAGN